MDKTIYRTLSNGKRLSRGILLITAINPYPSVESERINMKYHGCLIKKIIDYDVDGGCYYEIYKRGYIDTENWYKVTNAWTLDNAKEFIDSGFNYNVLG